MMYVVETLTIGMPMMSAMYKKQLLSGWLHMEPTWYTRGNSGFRLETGGKTMFPGLVFVQAIDDVIRG